MDIGFLFLLLWQFINVTVGLFVVVAMSTYPVDDPNRKKRITLTSVIGAVCFVLGGLCLAWLGIAGLLLMAIGLASFAMASAHFARAKGYGAISGLLAALLPLGSLTLIFVKAKNSTHRGWGWRRIGAVIAAIVVLPFDTVVIAMLLGRWFM
ncbi:MULTISPECIES: hypothetical protein [unclassified Cupriavidus]|uniref:hypothetical protein n=1 Tax=Cupriavidus sp. H19C3 TaxID=3241603 RepID=UPI003BF8B0F5